MGVHRTLQTTGLTWLTRPKRTNLLKTRHNSGHMRTLLGRQPLEPLLQ